MLWFVVVEVGSAALSASRVFFDSIRFTVVQEGMRNESIVYGSNIWPVMITEW